MIPQRYRIVWIVATLVWASGTPDDTSASINLYVSPAGHDSNPGTEAEPFKTIERAQSEVRLRTIAMHDDITVFLRGGTYQLTQSLRFDHRDSGMNGFQVIYRSFPGERAAISGGRPLSGWTPVEGGLYRAPAGGARFRQLYVDGARAVRARRPNAPEFLRLLRWDETSQEIFVPRDSLPSQFDLPAPEIVILKQWTQDNLRIASIGEREHEWFVRPREPDRTKAFLGHLFLRTPLQSYYLENALEFLDVPGEWYLGAATEEVFYKPRPNEDLSKALVIIPVLDRLVEIRGTGGDPVHDLTFMGLTLEYSSWMMPSEEGFVVSQADEIFLGSPPMDGGGRVGTAVSAAHAHHVRFDRNVFEHLGGSALRLDTDLSEIQVIGNRVRDVSGSGIVVDDLRVERPLDPRLVCRDILIANNLISHIGVDYRSSIAIFTGYVSRTRIEHNEITDVPYTGISLGWGWTDRPTLLGDNRIVGNHIARAMASMADGAGIYTLSKQPGTVISRNYVHHLARSSSAGDFPIAGIYLDEGSGDILVSDNVLEQVPLGVFLHHASRNRIVNTDGPHVERNGAVDNVIGQDTEFSPDAVKSTAGLEPEYADLRRLE